MNKILKNDEGMRNKIMRFLNIMGCIVERSWCDDGNIGVEVEKGKGEMVRGMLSRKFGGVRIGDGVQSGSIWVSEKGSEYCEEV